MLPICSRLVNTGFCQESRDKTGHPKQSRTDIIIPEFIYFVTKEVSEDLSKNMGGRDSSAGPARSEIKIFIGVLEFPNN